MRRRDFLCGALAASSVSAAATRRTNILLITGDDDGLTLGCYGDRRISTPSMDGLAATGVRFETAYVTQSSCSPSRSSIFTGLYPHSTGQFGLANTGYSLHEPVRKATIPAVLKRAGYRTGIIGKLHVEPESSFPWDFDERRLHGRTRIVGTAAAAAKRFLAEHGDSPFFLMVNFADPHAEREPQDAARWFFRDQVEGEPPHPIAPSQATVWDFQQVDTPEERKRVAGHLNAVARLDRAIGLLLDEFQKAGRMEDTLVICIGDNGPPFDRGKTTCYESGLRTPFLMRWPGVSKPSVSKALVSTVDIAPTIFDAAGVKSPLPLHGRSLRPVAAGGSVKGWREYLGGEFHYHGANVFFPRRAVRDQRWKLIHNIRAGQAKPPVGIDGDGALKAALTPAYANTPVRAAFERYADPPEFELYDLQKDPVEFTNLAGRPETRAVEARMKAALLAWRKETQDPFLDRARLEEEIRIGAPVTRKRRAKSP
jgi:N-sulfoglucosamine sulfohydrolase